MSATARPDAKKKTAIAAERSRDAIAEAQRKWLEWQTDPRPERLVFLDETRTSTTMARPCGRAPGGRRIEGIIPHGLGTTTAFIAALGHDRMPTPCIFDGPINGATFKAWIEQALAPVRQKGDALILDTLSSHKRAGVKETIDARAAERVSLLPCKP